MASLNLFFLCPSLLLPRTAETPSSPASAGARTPPPDSAIAAGCSALTGFLPFQVFLPGSGVYDYEVGIFWSNTQIRRPAASVDVGPGLMWDDVYAYLMDFERTAVGGRIPPSASRARRSAAGIGFQGNARGWAADNVLEYLKKAVFLQAAADYASYNTYALSYILPLVEIVNQTTTVGLVLFYDRDTEANPASLDQFFAIPTTNSTVASKTVAEFVIERNSFSIPDINDVLFAGTVVGGNGGDVRVAIQLPCTSGPDLAVGIPWDGLELLGQRDLELTHENVIVAIHLCSY
ncbi:hypothetical protein DL770_007233 [Monosporascus sp. CRB-9-2]|nr:hypothetical protein DL770_007233 [Monosporascus sp. CRB-9-2]